MNYSVIQKISIVIVLYLFVACTEVTHKNTDGFEYEYTCDAETIDRDKGRFIGKQDNPIFFGNIETQTKEEAFSGVHALKLTTKAPYGFTSVLKNVGPDEYIRATVWRKNENKSGVVVIDGGDGFYNASQKIVEEKKGWQKIYLEVFTPPTFSNGKLTIFAWNNTPDTVYFDDLQITYRDKKIFPEFSRVPSLQIHADNNDLNRFNSKRLDAFKTTVLVNSDDDYAKLVLYDGNNFLNGDFRLKGDLVDHIQGQKWSFRIKLKKEFAWKNMRTFSIQNPSTRGFLHEWVAHKIFQKEDVLTTRYGFVPVKLNNESLGIYAWEEHFDKQLIESQNRREGPIVRFDESVFWQRVIETHQTEREWDIDYFNAAKIIPFKAGRTCADSILNMELVEAQKLMLQYKKRQLPVSQVFDVSKLAKYYALIDITQAYHGFAWHNQRFYYNPVTCLLEPIAFDGYIEGGIYKRFDEQITALFSHDKVATLREEELLLFQPFNDEVFRSKYLKFLNEYSKPAFINTLVSELGEQTDSLSQIIKQEFPFYSYNFNYMKWQAEFIQQHFIEIEKNSSKIGLAISKIQSQKFAHNYTSESNINLIPSLVHAYYNKTEKKIEVLNYHNATLKVLGVFINEGFPESYDDKPEIEAYNGIRAQSVMLPVSGIPLKVLFEVGGELFESEVKPWSYFNTNTYRQLAFAQPLPADITIQDKVIEFDGDYRFDTDVIIPDSLTVFAKPGTKIDLVKGATFVSFSAINFRGTKENPIEIMSSDSSANGFNILQPAGKSRLEHVHFYGLSKLQKKGWQTPAAVTFYETEVELEECIFASNSNCDDALNIVRSEYNVTNCRFENTFADAFDSDFCTGLVKNCTFEAIGNDAIDFSGSNVKIENCKMFDIGDKAISGGEKSTLTVSNCEIDQANIGVAAKDLSKLDLDKIIMNKTVYGIVAFVKKPEYGPATISIDNLKMKNNMVFHQIEEGSSLRLNGKLIEGREKKLAIKLYQ